MIMIPCVPVQKMFQQKKMLTDGRGPTEVYFFEANGNKGHSEEDAYFVYFVG